MTSALKKGVWYYETYNVRSLFGQDSKDIMLELILEGRGGAYACSLPADRESRLEGKRGTERRPWWLGCVQGGEPG